MPAGRNTSLAPRSARRLSSMDFVTGSRHSSGSGSSSLFGRHGRRHSHAVSTTSGDLLPASSGPPSYHRESGSGLAQRFRRSSRRHSQQTSALPAYGQAVALDSHRSGTEDAGHGSAGRELHEFHLRSGSGYSGAAPWATLKVQGRSGATGKHGPKICGGDSVTGSIELTLEKAQTINSVTLSLRGRYITGSLEENSFTFLNQVTTIWDKNAGDPRLPYPSPLDFDGSKKTKFNAKLEGHYSWPFSLHFPTEIILPGKNGSAQQVIHTPQSFLERGVGANIQYCLVMHITHGLFKPNSKLQVDIQYAPNVSPPPASFLRQQAYLQGGFLLPPSEDPTGWFNHPEVHFQHRFDTTGPFDCGIQLSLAQPLAYTRGTVIPAFVSLSTHSPHTLGDLSTLLLQHNQPLLEVRLFRRIQYVLDALYATAPVGSKGRVMRSAEEWVGTKATWWKPTSAQMRPSTEGEGCDLEGEIHLEGDLEPSCDSPFFSAEYFVKLISRVPPASMPASPSASSPRSAARHAHSASSSHHPPPSTLSPTHRSFQAPYPVTAELASVPVSITTFHVHGPLPTPYTIPSRQARGGHGHSSDEPVLKGGKHGRRRSIVVEDVFGEGGSFERQAVGRMMHR